jgi:hypothetical protein
MMIDAIKSTRRQWRRQLANASRISPSCPSSISWVYQQNPVFQALASNVQPSSVSASFKEMVLFLKDAGCF